MPLPTGSQPSEPPTESVGAPGTDTDSPYPSPVTYQRKYTRCNKLTCSQCAEGPGHGPYWYAFWWENGRTRSRYLGKTAPAAALAAIEAPPPAAPPASDPAPTPDQWEQVPAALPIPAVCVTTLGRFAIERDGAILPEPAWPRRTAITLFKFLLSAPGRRQTRDQVLDSLWPDEDPAAARLALRMATHAVRHALDVISGASVLLARVGTLALAEQARLWVDADAFTATATVALAGRDIASCRAALAYYGGDYLPDDLYEDWAEQRREELASLRISVLLHQARLCGEGGDLAEARAALAAVLAADPLHEDAAIRQMTILAAAGDRAEALRVYEKLRAALEEELGVEP